MAVEAIKDAIAGMLVAERHSLASRLNDLDYDAWSKASLRAVAARPGRSE